MKRTTSIRPSRTRPLEGGTPPSRIFPWLQQMGISGLALTAMLFAVGAARANDLADLSRADGETRARAAWMLGATTNRAARAALAPLKEDPYPGARAAAGWALGRIGAPESADALRSFVTDPVRTVRLSAVRGIQEGGQIQFFRVLLPRLDYEVRMDVDTNNTAQITAVVVWAEPDPAVRVAAVQALGALGAVDALPAMIYAMEREISYNRVALRQAIEAFGTRAAGVCLGRIVPTPYDQEAFEQRLALLINNGTLAVIAGQVGDDRCIPHLLKTLMLPRQKLGADKDLTEVYLDTIELLGRFKVEAAAVPLAALLKETRVRQVSEATQAALRAIGPAAARPLAVNAGDWQLAPVFLPLLREPALRHREVEDTIVKFLTSESDEVRREAVETLGLYLYEGIFDEYDIPLLEAMYLDPSRDVRAVYARWKDKINTKFGEGTVQ